MPESSGWGLGMNMYTPPDIWKTNNQHDERPYTGWLYGSQYLTWVNSETDSQGDNYAPNSIHDLEIQLGVLGEWARQDRIQKAWHILFSGDDPNGWRHQKKGEMGINATYRYHRAIDSSLNDLRKDHK